ncbi:MAG: helix-turn-helix domain-containing protein [Candidatus Nanoarchaeia archaeon]
MEKIHTILQEFGFEEREIKIYLSLLTHSQSTALQLSQHTGIDRTTVYDLLQKLIQKRIVFSLIKQGTKCFTALSPEELLSHFQNKYVSLQQIIPELEELTQQSPLQFKCETFYGLEGLKIVLKDFVKVKSDYKIIGIREEYEQILGYFVEQGIITLNHFNVKEEAILEEGFNVKKLKQSTHRTVKKGTLSPFTTVLYKEHVLFISWTKPYSILRIENPAFYQSQLDQFNLLWKNAK